MCIVVENSLNVSILVSQKEEMARGRRIGEKRDRRPRTFAIVRECHRMSPYHHPSLIKREGRSLHIAAVNYSLSQRSHARTYARIHGITRARVSYERRRCVELVQGILRNKKK